MYGATMYRGASYRSHCQPARLQRIRWRAHPWIPASRVRELARDAPAEQRPTMEHDDIDIETRHLKIMYLISLYQLQRDFPVRCKKGMAEKR